MLGILIREACGNGVPMSLSRRNAKVAAILPLSIGNSMGNSIVRFSKIIKILWLLKTCFVSSCACAMICHDDLPWVQAANHCAASCSVFRCAPSGRTEPGHRADHVTMAQGHHLLEGAIANASPEASQAWQRLAKTLLNHIQK